MVKGITYRNRKLYMDLIKGLDDLGSIRFREHWYYRREQFYTNTNAHSCVMARKMYEKLADLARAWIKENRL